MGARARGAMGNVGPGSAHCIFSAWPLELPSLTFSATSVAVVDKELSCYDLPNAEPPYRAMAIIMPGGGHSNLHWTDRHPLALSLALRTRTPYDVDPHGPIH